MRSDAPNFRQLREVLIEGRFDEVPLALSSDRLVEVWSHGKFRVEGGVIYHGDRRLPQQLNGRIMAMVRNGDDPQYLLNFWERLQRNPSSRSVEQLYPFLEHEGIAIDKDGTFLAYKGVRNDYRDAHTGKIDNRPGTSHRMERNLISDDPRTPCHFGFHVGALSYASTFSQRTIVCKVDPEDVVCIPYDESARKMRVCAYSVVGEYGAKLPDTNYDLEADIGDELEPCDECEGDCLVDTDLDLAESNEPTANELVGDAILGIAQRLAAPRGFKRLHAMYIEELLDQSTEDLRRYASKGLKIVNASRIPGGKVALVQAISAARGF